MLVEDDEALEAMLDAIPDIIGVQDIERRIIRFNKAGYEFFGMDDGGVFCRYTSHPGRVCFY